MYSVQYNFKFLSKQMRFYFNFIAVKDAWKDLSIKLTIECHIFVINSYTIALSGGIVIIKLKILIKL
jgi:hypothetical protein